MFSSNLNEEVLITVLRICYDQQRVYVFQSEIVLRGERRLEFLSVEKFTCEISTNETSERLFPRSPF